MPMQPRIAVFLMLVAVCLGWSSNGHAQHHVSESQLPHWLVEMDRVDILVGGKPLRWKDGDCRDDEATGNCITRIYELPVKAHNAQLVCSYHYEMSVGRLATPSHAPYIHHWPIDLDDVTKNRSLATRWSAQPLGHVYAHMHIYHDSLGNLHKQLGTFPAHRTCDNMHYAGCFWDVDPDRLQVVHAPWHGAAGDHVLRCTLHSPHAPDWYPSPRPVSQIRVHVPFPPRQRLTGRSIGKMAQPDPSHLAALPKPKLAIRSAHAVLAHSCDARHLVTVSFSVQNDGGPLVRRGSDLAYIQAEESGGALLKSAAKGMPDLAHGQSWHASLVLGTREPLSKLSGKHLLLVHIGPTNALKNSLAYVPPPPFRIRLNVPNGYCQPPGRSRSLSAPRPNVGHAKPSMAKPDPSSSQRRLQLPAVQKPRNH